MAEIKRSPTLKKALAALIENGGEGIVDSQGHLLAAGEVLGSTPYDPYAAATWLRLLTIGDLEVAGPLRVRVKVAA